MMYSRRHSLFPLSLASNRLSHLETDRGLLVCPEFLFAAQHSIVYINKKGKKHLDPQITICLFLLLLSFFLFFFFAKRFVSIHTFKKQ